MRTFIAATLTSAFLLAFSTGASTAAEPGGNTTSSQSSWGAVREGVIAFEGSDGLYVIDANGGKARMIAGTLPRDGDGAERPRAHVHE